jgi:colanic acid/amylovoran biosynthesis protein
VTRFLLTGVSLSSGNRGIAAIALGTMVCLSQSYPEAEFATFGLTAARSRLVERRLSLRGQPLRVCEAESSVGRACVAALRSYASRAPVRDAALRRFWWADVVVDLSGGDGFADTYGLKRFLGGCLEKLVALRVGKPLMIFPQTVGPLRTCFSRVCARYFLSRARLVCVREKISERIVRDILGPRADKVACLADMAFLMDRAEASQSPALMSELTRAEGRIGVNVSALLWNRGPEMLNSQGWPFDYRRAIVTLIRRLVQETGRSVILVPHVLTGQPETCDWCASRAVLARLSDLEGQVSLISADYSAPELKALIGRCSFFVGSRMHACIAALSTETPVMPISYSHKFGGILDQFGIGEWVADPGMLSGEQVVAQALRAYEKRDEIRRRITEALPAVRSDAMQAGQLMRTVLGRAQAWAEAEGMRP